MARPRHRPDPALPAQRTGVPARLTEVVGRDSIEPTFEQREANGVSILPRQQRQDARFARASFVGRVGSTECCPTEIWRSDAGLPGQNQITKGSGKKPADLIGACPVSRQAFTGLVQQRVASTLLRPTQSVKATLVG